MPSKVIRLMRDSKNAYPPQKAKKQNSKKVPWVDVSDDERDDRRRKTPLGVKANGHQPNGHPHPHSHHHQREQEGRNHKRHKKARHSMGTGAGLVEEWSTAGPSGSNGTAAALQEQRRNLPIAKGREALIQEIRNNDVTVLLGETGSGKTTQVPQYILESGLARTGMIAVTQPRRVAATSLAARVAAEKNEPSVGRLVGYAVRFDERAGAQTRIKYMTDGMIVRELLSDPLLSRYSVVVVDEAHERTLRTDLLLTNLKTIQRTRNGAGKDEAGTGKGKGKAENPLKIVIMSATLDAEKFSKFFNNAKILYVKGRQHPVKIYYSSEGQTDYVDSAMRTFFQVHTDQPPGDVLIFLPGQEDIESLEKSIKLFANQLPKDEMEVLICPMYAAQAPGQNAKVFAPTPSNSRKCILSTNIAETSITIPGVKYVIDTGMCKEKRYLARDTGGGFDTLLTKAITKSSAMQRAGRAGREGMGACFRLYTEDAFNNMALAPEPEIMRCSLTSSILQLKCLNQNLEELDLMDMPDVDSISSALKTLWLLDAINPNRELTPLGLQMALFPLEPIHARAVLASRENGCTLEVLDIISVLSASSKLFVDITEQRETAAEARRMFTHPSSDHLTILNAVRAYGEIVAGSAGKAARKDWCRKHFLNERTLLEASEIRVQLRQTCGRMGIDWKISCGDKEEPVVKSLAYGLAQNSAFLQPDGSYKQTMGQSVVKIHPSSVLCEKKVPAIVYDELIFTNQIYARGVSSVPKTVFAGIGALNRRIA
ncbi:putative ATP-dependent RNA helicase prh1 [Hypsizygus marmoreus]|uniref:RNA helicase n=1 Tax=Hypsizygus marmoreus TaxID=39966 RepID=A0A369J991_HYPMA|nr:putative ATP-dependent RNA helicase prh1 [Hypsizygus marmoreus]